MSSSPYQRIKQVVTAARLLSGAARQEYLDEACGADVSLRAEVDSLLPHVDAEQGPLEDGFGQLPGDALARAVNAAADRAARGPGEGSSGTASGREALGSEDGDGAPIPEHIGPFRIVRRLANGGMGTVYEAVQENPSRRVALKTLRRELVSPSLLQRFQRESEILGRLQHPGIAQIHGAGSVMGPDGPLPYFAMEFVEGQQLMAYAESRGLGQADRLALFARICDAVHYAHGRGVIHRDLKPDNILVTGEGQPKVLDFGVARATDADIQAATFVTEVGQIMGTLPYMSPEQLSGDPSALGTRSDVYSLGVVLFELLAGRRPHDLGKRSMIEAAQVIREADATRLGTIATHYRGDVETIVGKALEKDADRRYAGADKLAADIRRHLSDQPIAARAPSRLYLVRKFARRHTGLVLGLSLAFIALTAGVAFSLRFAFNEAQQRQRAEFAGYRALIAAAMAALDDGERMVAQALLREAPEALRGWEWHHAAARAEPQLWEHERRLTKTSEWGLTDLAVAFSADESLLAALVSEDRVDVFEAETGAYLHSLQLDGPLSRGCLAATDSGFITITLDGHVTHWDGSTGELLEEDLIPGPIHSMAWDQEHRRLVVANATASGGEARLYAGSIGSLRRVHTEDSGNAAYRSIAWTHGGRTLLATNTQDGVPGLWDLLTDDGGEPTLGLRSRLDVTTVYAAHGNLILASPSGAKTDKLVVLDLAGDELLRLDPQLQPWIIQGCFSNDGRRIVTTSKDSSHRIVTVYEAADGRAFARWTSSSQVLSALSPSGRLLAIGSTDRLQVMALDALATTVLPGADDYVYGLAWTPDGRTLWARNYDMSYRGYDVVAGTVLVDLPRPGQVENQNTHFLRTWGVSADGRQLVATHHLSPGEAVMGVSTHDLVSGGPWRELPGPRWEGPTDNSLFDAVHMARTSRLQFLLATGVIGPSAARPEDVAFTRTSGSHPRVQGDPSGQLLAGPIALYVERVDGTGQVPLLVGGHPLPDSDWQTSIRHADASFSPDGRLIAAVRPSIHEGAVVHDVTSGDTVIELLTGIETRASLYAVAFSPDGRRLAVGGTDRVVSLFDTSSWQLVARLEGHRGYIKDIAWSPDGATLASAGGDGTVRLWSTRPLAERTAAAHTAAARREHQRAWVVKLFEQLDDPSAVADAVRADATRDGNDRHAALRVVRELADAWWAARESELDDR